MFKKPSNDDLKKMLSKEEFDVTQNDATERPHDNKYNKHFEQGIYVDIVSGEPLFSSTAKYDSGSGWPAFYEPIDSSHIVKKEDRSLFLTRVEVRSKIANSHLGHVFEDGPAPTGLRYCINSASLKFIALKDLDKFGLSEYKKLFEISEKKLNPSLKKATFGAGCFWGVEAIFAKLEGVKNAESGYSGGVTDNPDYQQVSTGRTGHAEVVEVTYDENIISYETLLDYFWRMHDPSTPNQQGPNIGSQYRSVIFYHNEEQKKLAENTKEKISKSGLFKRKIITEIIPAVKFYKAEEYHQDYYDKKYEGKPGPICHTLRDV